MPPRLIEDPRSIEAGPILGAGPVTLGEVYRLLLTVRAELKEHTKGHDMNARWFATTLIAVGALVLGVATRFA